MALWRGRLFGRGAGRRPPPEDAGRPEAVAPPPPPDDALSGLLAQIEALALDIYREHGLPVRRGHYRRGPRAAHWTFLGEHLEPEARWALVLERPPERGWRYGVLEELGLHGGQRGAAIAAGLLGDCARLRRWRQEGLSAADALAAAIRLGAEWRAVREARAMASGARLALTRPAGARKANR